MNTVVLLKLDNDEEIIGSVITENNEEVVIENPMQLHFQEFENGTGMTLMNYIPYSDETIVNIKNKNIVIKTPVSNKVKEFYAKSIYYDRHFLHKRFDTTMDSAIEQLSNLIDTYVDKQKQIGIRKNSVAKSLEGIVDSKRLENLILSASLPTSNSVN
jgi:hypothetical protein